MGPSVPWNLHPMLYNILWFGHGCSHEFSVVWLNLAIIWEEPGTLIHILYSREEVFLFRLIPVSWDTKKKTIFALVSNISLLPDLVPTEWDPKDSIRTTSHYVELGKHLKVFLSSISQCKSLNIPKELFFLLTTLVWVNKIWKIYLPVKPKTWKLILPSIVIIWVYIFSSFPWILLPFPVTSDCL